MKRLLLIFGLLLAPASAMACNTYTSTQKAPGERVLTDEGLEFVIREDGKVIRYTTGSAGTGTGIRIGFPEDRTEPIEISQTSGEYWVGPERFVEFCQ